MEVFESIEVLQNRGPEDTTELCLALAGEMLLQGGTGLKPRGGGLYGKILAGKKGWLSESSESLSLSREAQRTSRSIRPSI